MSTQAADVASAPAPASTHPTPTREQTRLTETDGLISALGRTRSVHESYDMLRGLTARQWRRVYVDTLVPGISHRTLLSYAVESLGKRPAGDPESRMPARAVGCTVAECATALLDGITVDADAAAVFQPEYGGGSIVHRIAELAAEDVGGVSGDAYPALLQRMLEKADTEAAKAAVQRTDDYGSQPLHVLLTSSANPVNPAKTVTGVLAVLRKYGADYLAPVAKGRDAGWRPLPLVLRSGHAPLLVRWLQTESDEALDKMDLVWGDGEESAKGQSPLALAVGQLEKAPDADLRVMAEGTLHLVRGWMRWQETRGRKHVMPQSAATRLHEDGADLEKTMEEYGMPAVSAAAEDFRSWLQCCRDALFSILAVYRAARLPKLKQNAAGAKVLMDLSNAKLRIPRETRVRLLSGYVWMSNLWDEGVGWASWMRGSIEKLDGNLRGMLAQQETVRTALDRGGVPLPQLSSAALLFLRLFDVLLTLDAAAATPSRATLEKSMFSLDFRLGDKTPNFEQAVVELMVAHGVPKKKLSWFERRKWFDRVTKKQSVAGGGPAAAAAAPESQTASAAERPKSSKGPPSTKKRPAEKKKDDEEEGEKEEDEHEAPPQAKKQKGSAAAAATGKGITKGSQESAGLSAPKSTPAVQDRKKRAAAQDAGEDIEVDDDDDDEEKDWDPAAERAARAATFKQRVSASTRYACFLSNGDGGTVAVLIPVHLGENRAVVARLADWLSEQSELPEEYSFFRLVTTAAVGEALNMAELSVMLPAETEFHFADGVLNRKKVEKFLRRWEQIDERQRNGLEGGWGVFYQIHKFLRPLGQDEHAAAAAGGEAESGDGAALLVDDTGTEATSQTRAYHVFRFMIGEDRNVENFHVLCFPADASAAASEARTKFVRLLQDDARKQATARSYAKMITAYWLTGPRRVWTIPFTKTQLAETEAEWLRDDGDDDDEEADQDADSDETIAVLASPLDLPSLEKVARKSSWAQALTNLVERTEQ